mmetsp:Transcript_14623/g.31807  ORF Transcript_14623/g.31807 Transcript_14623/m.31807 type:complete len:184 (-) Transcript_14623:184-735(-)|eukprot:CAMPEP_0172319504 /NCGR_PEP_ID=MMETSP1058-20130122/37838_1 /TAXON_ID=83371 /ORGANISM="Detonula confervacea, Strain CCMP 353" /LENGTH=183 /DNA_ID=CAMNT_0013034559 /DNA_START=131 /DNA_END=682 /DNA_ORIENTATION=+
MALSISDAYKPKRESKTPRRRATVDTPCLGLARPKQKMQRRLSLPLKKSVQFSELSEVCVFEPSPTKRWYSDEDHHRFKRERISDVVSFREQSRQNMGASINPPSASPCCPVGLEQLLSTEGMLEAHSNRKTVIQSVLREQNRQKFFGVQDPVKMAFLSFRLSAEALEGAQKRGKFQEMAKFV